MKNFNFTSILKLKTKFGLIILTAIVLLCSNLGFSQTPQLFEDKVLIKNISVPWGFTFINSNEVLFTEKKGKHTDILFLPIRLLK